MLERIIEILSIIVPVFLALYASYSKKSRSSFYTFITLADEDFVNASKIKRNVLLCILYLLNIVFVANRIWPFLPISESLSRNAILVGGILLSLVIIAILIINNCLVFSDNKFIDKRLKKNKGNISIMRTDIESIFRVSLILWGTLAVIISMINIADKDIVMLVIYSIFFVVLGLNTILCSYVYLYFKIRRYYYINNMCITTRTHKEVYNNVSSYKKTNAILSFVCEQDGIKKRIILPIDEIASINCQIDTKSSFLDEYKRKMEDEEKEEKGYE